MSAPAVRSRTSSVASRFGGISECCIEVHFWHISAGCEVKVWIPNNLRNCSLQASLGHSVWCDKWQKMPFTFIWNSIFVQSSLVYIATSCPYLSWRLPWKPQKKTCKNEELSAKNIQSSWSFLDHRLHTFEVIFKRCVKRCIDSPIVFQFQLENRDASYSLVEPATVTTWMSNTSNTQTYHYNPIKLKSPHICFVFFLC